MSSRELPRVPLGGAANPAPKRLFAVVDADASQDVDGLVLDAVDADWFEGGAPAGP